jgi:hypothetical protein
MKIQELAQLTGLTTKAIRYYESIGILLLQNVHPTAIAITTSKMQNVHGLSPGYAPLIYP